MHPVADLLSSERDFIGLALLFQLTHTNVKLHLVWRQQKINNCCKLFVATLFIFLSVGSCLFGEHYVFAQTDQTASNLQAANSVLEQAFNTVLDAEKAGANVTSLLTQLSDVADILAKAENSYRTGDFNKAAVQADSVIPIAHEVTISVQDVHKTALVSAQNAFWFTIAFTVIGSFVFVLVLSLVWRRFKRGYLKQLLDLKPEVVENAT